MLHFQCGEAVMRNTVSLNSDADFPKRNLEEKEKENELPNSGI